MIVQSDISLRAFNTFGLEARAAHFTPVRSAEEVQAAIQTGLRPLRVLGGGSNILFTQPVTGLLLKNEIKGIAVTRTWSQKVHVTVGGGENWHAFVLWAVQNGYGGVENLSLIPGTVGAAPVQNIGAYGVELKDVMVRLRAVELETGKLRTFSKRDCAFGYRDSIFKRAAKGKYLITEVVFSLTRSRHRIHIQYGDIAQTLQTMLGDEQQPTIADVSRAVIQIRSSKLPDPAQIGNCGSFFKNPEISAEQFQWIKARFPQAPGYPLPDGKVKIPAGWLIEQCGWKGKRVGNTGCYEKQALVIVNHGEATGPEVQQLAADIIQSVLEKFEVALEPEVNIW